MLGIVTITGYKKTCVIPRGLLHGGYLVMYAIVGMRECMK